MSTNIGNGRVVHAPLSKVYDLLIAAKPDAMRIGRTLQASWIARHAAALIDKADLNGETPPAYPIGEAWSALNEAEREIRSTMRQNPDADFEFELWILPLSNRRTLLMVHTEQRRFLDWLDALEFVEDYRYWDSTDRPDELTSQAWERRRRDWDRVLPSGVPSDRCLTLVMFNHQMPSLPAPKEALVHIAQPAERAVTHARVMHIDEVYRRMIEDRREADPDYAPQGFSLFFEAEREARSAEGRRAEIVAEATARLRAITAADLTRRD